MENKKEKGKRKVEEKERLNFGGVKKKRRRKRRRTEQRRRKRRKTNEEEGKRRRRRRKRRRCMKTREETERASDRYKQHCMCYAKVTNGHSITERIIKI